MLFSERYSVADIPFTIRSKRIKPLLQYGGLGIQHSVLLPALRRNGLCRRQIQIGSAAAHLPGNARQQRRQIGGLFLHSLVPFPKQFAFIFSSISVLSVITHGKL